MTAQAGHTFLRGRLPSHLPMPSESPLSAFANRRLTSLLVSSGLLLVIGGGALMGLPVALLLAAGVVLTAVISLMWQSLQQMSGDTELSFEEALSLAAPTAEEEQKRAALRTLKDLEYERSVGKISEEDFLELSARYRAEAKRLILVVDDTLQERRRKAEKLLERRLQEVARSKPPPEEEAAADETPGSQPEEDAASKRPSDDDDAPPSLDPPGVETSAQEENS